MKLSKIALVAVLMQIVEANHHCHRYHNCITDARDNYERCIGGTASAIITDNENIKNIDSVMKQADELIICEAQALQRIDEYRLARQHEDEDILRCTSVFTTHPTFGNVSDIKKIACTETPSLWNLRNLVGGSKMRPSQCREIYDLQNQRCSFLLSCCPVYSLCLASVSLNSTIHSKVLNLREKLASDVNECINSSSAILDEKKTESHRIESLLKKIMEPSSGCLGKTKLCKPEALRGLRDISDRLAKTMLDSSKFCPTQRTTSGLPEIECREVQNQTSKIPHEATYLAVDFPKPEKTAQLSANTKATQLFADEDSILIANSPNTRSSRLKPSKMEDRKVFTAEQSISSSEIEFIPPLIFSSIASSTNNSKSSSNTKKVSPTSKDTNRELKTFQEESIAFCEKTLACEENLKQRELICQRQYVYPNLILADNSIWPATESYNKLSDISDMSVQAEILANSEVADMTKTISKACMRPITTDILQQLSKLLGELESSRKSCTRLAAYNQNMLSIHDENANENAKILIQKSMCRQMVADEIRMESDVDRSQFNDLKTRQNGFDYCTARLASIKEQCATLRQCCPGYTKCTELMIQSDTSSKYYEMLRRTKQIQSDCERKIMGTLQSLHSAFIPLNS
uniref:Pectinesterase inhibitor domain-containing protein n=1 Tax=Setaria digitata TaxID=48799 RepID=A0A915PN72_9BILA